MVALFGVYLFIMYINAKVVKQVKMLVELNYEPVEKDKIKSSSKIVTDESMPLLHKGTVFCTNFLTFLTFLTFYALF